MTIIIFSSVTLIINTWENLFSHPTGPNQLMFLQKRWRHSLALPEDRVTTKEAEASVMLTASVSSASAVSGLEIRRWWHHLLEYVSTFSCGTLALLQRSESEICSAYFSCLLVQQRSGCHFTPTWYLSPCLPVLLCPHMSYGTLGRVPFASHGQQTQEGVHSEGKEVRGDYKYISMFISVRSFSARGRAGGGVSRVSSRTRRMTGNRRRIWCETGSGRGGQQDDGRRGCTTEMVEKQSGPFRKGPKIFLYSGLICSICVLILGIDKYSVAVGSLTNKRPMWSGIHTAHKYKIITVIQIHFCALTDTNEQHKCSDFFRSLISIPIKKRKARDPPTFQGFLWLVWSQLDCGSNMILSWLQIKFNRIASN